ncbi:hypothetical protein BC941DRAFT_9990 [Chlamydoabsidia padenii]|nr:hypothetical protein BC941DRAFT_9990 [Chlamydoabsidia padenii]
MDIPNSDQAVGENADHVSPEAESCNNVQIEQDGDVTSDNPTGQFDKSSTPWRILGSQNDSSDLHVNDKKLDGQQSQNRTSNGRLYIKIIAAENLDFPINQGAPSIQCSVNDGNQYLGSGHYKMQHNIHFNHEFILDNMAPNGEFTLTLHVIRPGEQTTTKRWPKRSSGKHDDLTRYISQQDGALAQTRVSLKSVSYQCRTKLCTASFALVNGWYQPAKKSTSHHPLFLSKAQKEKRNGPVQEKAVGKITLELFYLPNADYKIPDLPADMDACENALNVQRFHQTVWRYGYMSQLGGDVKFWRRRYFKLIGGHLYSNTDTSQSPRTIIDLSKAIAITSDNRIIMEAKTNNTNLNRFDNDVVQALLMELESQINIGNLENQSSPYQLGNDTPQYQRTCSNNNLALDCALSSVSTLTASITQDDEDLSSYSVKNSFQLKFNNGDKIEFFCDSTFERERWLDVLKVIIGRIPTLPTWLSACMT